MSAYVFLILAIATRVLLATGSHAGHPWWNFTAVGGSLLFFGGTRSLRSAWFPVVALAVTDFMLTRYAYGFPFHAQDYLITWCWYVAAVLLGAALLRVRVSAPRIVGASAASATLFFLASNFVGLYPVSMYPHTWHGMVECYTAGIPFYRNDLVSTTVTLAAAFGVRALLRGRAEQPVTSHGAAA